MDGKYVKTTFREYIKVTLHDIIVNEEMDVEKKQLYRHAEKVNGYLNELSNQLDKILNEDDNIH